MAEFDITDTHPLPDNASTVTGKLTLSKTGETSIIATAGPLTVADPVVERYYSGTFNLIPGHGNNISYKAPASTVEFEGFDEGLPSGNIDIDGRASGANNMGMRWTCPGGAGLPGEPTQYLLDYQEQPWDLIVTTTDETLNSDPNSVNVGTNTFSYYWGAGSLSRFTDTNVTLREGDLQLGSDAWPLDPNWFPWGESPTFTLSVAGATPPPPDPTNDSWEALKSRISNPDENDEVDLGGLVYCIQNEFELEDYSEIGIELSNINATVTNGSLTGSFNPNLLTWSAVGDGATYKASLPEAIVNSPSFDTDYTRWQLVDSDQPDHPYTHPLYQVRIPGAPGSDGAQSPSRGEGTGADPNFYPHRWTWTGDWIFFESLNTGNPSGSNSPYGDDGIWNEGDMGWNPNDGFRVERAAGASQTDYIEAVRFANNAAGDEYLAQFNKATNGAFEVGSEKWRDLSVLIHFYPNLIKISKIDEWDPSTRRMVFKEKFLYNFYFKFAFNGVDVDSPTESLEVGEYFWKTETSELFYKPVDPSFIQNHIDGVPGAPIPKVYIPAVARLFNLDSCDLTLQGLEIFSQHGNNQNAYFITGDKPSGGTESFLRLNDCTTYATNELSKDVIIIARRNTFIDTNKRFMTCYWGDFRNNFFGNSYNQSVLNFTAAYSDGSPGIVIKDNFFTLEASAHGQCVATYNSNWQNVLIEHNIFYNCKAVLSYQPTSNLQTGYDQRRGDRGHMGEYRFANNLVYMNNLAIVPAGQGQTGLSFNGNPDWNLSSEQKINWLSNTIWTDTTYENDFNAVHNHINKMQVTLDEHTTSDLVCANNISRCFRQTNNDPGNARNGNRYFTGEFKVAEGDSREEAKFKFENDVDSNGNPTNIAENMYTDDEQKYGTGPDSLRNTLPRELLKSASICNAIYGRNTQTAADQASPAYGRSDLPELPYKDFDGGAIDPDGVFNESTLQPEGLWTTSASDNGAIGIRWASIPTVAQLEQINSTRNFNWSEDFPAEEYPVPEDSDGDGINDRITSSAGDTYIFNESDRVLKGDDFRGTP